MMGQRLLMSSILVIFLVTGCGLPFSGESTSESAATAELPTEAATNTLSANVIADPSPTPFSTVAPGGIEMSPTLTLPAGAAADQSESLLQTVKNRSILKCGVNGGLGGFSLEAPDGTFTGFDVDFCRVIAAAIFGDPNAVEFVPLNTSERFQAVVDGTVDVLIRNTTWTATRDTGMSGDDAGIRLDFGPTIFHDGQRFMVRKNLTITGTDIIVTEVAHLEGKRICVQKGTTTELNLNDQFQARGIKFEPVVLEDIDLAYDAYEKGVCDAITSDTSQLNSRRAQLEQPDDHIILGEQISREPLGPVFIENDSQWRDVVSWAIFAAIYAEELGVDSTNAAALADAENPAIRRLLGTEEPIGGNLGLSDDFALQIIQKVGNYEEIFNRNLGPDTPYAMEHAENDYRGPNKAWNKGRGGVLSSPPFR